MILRRFAGIDPTTKPGVLVAGHAPFCWGRIAAAAAHSAILLEEIACLAYHALAINPETSAISDALPDKHFLRKHGPKAYYGQK